MKTCVYAIYRVDKENCHGCNGLNSECERYMSMDTYEKSQEVLLHPRIAWFRNKWGDEVPRSLEGVV